METERIEDVAGIVHHVKLYIKKANIGVTSCEASFYVDRDDIPNTFKIDHKASFTTNQLTCLCCVGTDEVKMP